MYYDDDDELFFQLKPEHFKSFTPYFNASLLNNLNHLLEYQIYINKSTPDDMWDKIEVEDFKIVLSDVDRIYIMKYYNMLTGNDKLLLFVRMKYKDKYVFARLFIRCEETASDEWTGDGDIYFTTNADLFYHKIRREISIERHDFRKALESDGYIISRVVKNKYNNEALNMDCDTDDNDTIFSDSYNSDTDDSNHYDLMT